MRNLICVFLFNLKSIGCHNSVYLFKTDDDALNFPSIPALLHAHVSSLTSFFPDLDNVAAEAVLIVKPLPPTLEVVNAEDAPPSRVGPVIPISATFQDSSLMFGPTSLNPCGPSRKRTITNSDSVPHQK